MIFSFEKMVLCDAGKSVAGAKAFAEGLYDFLHGRGDTSAELALMDLSQQTIRAKLDQW